MIEHATEINLVDVFGTGDVVEEDTDKLEVIIHNDILEEVQQKTDSNFFDIKKIIKIPKNYAMGDAVDFFDAFSQLLAESDDIIKNNAEALSAAYNEFCIKNKSLVDSWGNDNSDTESGSSILLSGERSILNKYSLQARALCTLLNKKIGIIVVTNDEIEKIKLYFILVNQEGKKAFTKEIMEKMITSTELSTLFFSPQSSSFYPLLKNTKIMGRKKSYKKILYNSLPPFLTSFIAYSALNLNYFISGIFLKEVNRETFAAMSLIRAETLFFITLLTAPLNAISITVGHAFKAKIPFRNIARTAQSGWLLAGVLSLPVMALFSAAKPILLGLGQNATLVDVTQSFFWPYLGGVTPLFLQFATVMFLYAINKNGIVIGMSLLLNLGFSLALTYILTTDRLGARLGATGYGIAQTVTNGIALITYMAILFFKKEFKKFLLFKWHKKYFTPIVELLKLGLPIIVAFLGEMGVLLSFSIMAGVLGKDELIAQNVYSLYLSLLTISSIALFRSTSVLSSRAFSEQKFHDLKRYTIVNTALSMVFPLVFLLPFSIAPTQMSQIYINATDAENKNITDILSTALPLTAAGNLFDSTRLAISGALLGMQDAALPSIVNCVVQLFIVIPLMYALGFHTSLGISGFLVAYGIGGLILSVFMGFRFNQTFHQKIEEVKNQNFEITFNEDHKSMDILKADNENPPSASSTSTSSNFWGMDLNFFKRAKNSKPQDQLENIVIKKNESGVVSETMAFG